MKILHVAPAFCENGGGIAEVVENLTKEQASRKYQLVDVLGLADYSGMNVKGRNVYSYLPTKHSRLKGCLKTFLFLIKNYARYDVIHIHGAWSLQFILILPFLYKSQKKIIYQPHGLLDPVRNKKNLFLKKIALFSYQGMLVSCSCKIIACSTKEMKELTFMLRTSNSIDVISNGIDNCFFIDNSTESRYENRILFLSQIIPIKNIESIIRAVSILKLESNLDLFLDVYGYGSENYINSLLKLASDLGVSRNISFFGNVSKECRVKTYDRYKYFVLPSLSENFALVILEALSRGCFVITSTKTPWHEYTHERLSIVEPNYTSLVEQFRRLYFESNTVPLSAGDENYIDLIFYRWSSIANKFDAVYNE